MAKDNRIYDPDGDLLFILQPRKASPVESTAPSTSSRKSTGRGPGGRGASSSLPHKPPALATQDIKFLVSSKHMMLASPVFKAMLGHFREGEDLRNNGKVEVPLPDDDPVAFAILLDIIHGRSRKVPRKVELDFLLTLAVLVDKYQMHEPVAIYSDGWIDALVAGRPEQEVAAVSCWLCIAWVFKREEEFKRATFQMIFYKQSLSNTTASAAGELPIPDAVFKLIITRRETTIRKLHSVLDAEVRDLQSDHSMCLDNVAAAFRCDSMALGALLKQCQKIKLLPHSVAPEIVDILPRMMKSIKMESACRYSDCAKNRQTNFHRQIDQVVSQVKGLSLKDFEKRRIMR